MAMISLSGAKLRFLPLLLILFVSARALAGQEQLGIRTSSGDQLFIVELADTAQLRATGLINRRELAADAGMLFDFSKSAKVSMWMKDTLIPLDMLFIRADGRIANIAERTVPGSLTPIDSQGPVLGVLELNGGTSARLDIKPGDKILHPLFGTAP
jgi:uncharacterized protein